MWRADVADIKGSSSPVAGGRWADVRRRVSAGQRVGRYCVSNVNRYCDDILTDIDSHRYRYGFAFLVLASIIGPNLYGCAILYGGGYLAIWHGNRSALRDLAGRCHGRLTAGRRIGRFTARGHSREWLG